MMRLKVLIILVLSIQMSFASIRDTLPNALADLSYAAAYNEIGQMMEGKKPYSFKRAVFITENAYFGNSLDDKKFDKDIALLKLLCEGLISSRDLAYDEDDKKTMEKYAAIFTVLSDTVPVQLETTKMMYHLPFRYDFEDAFGYQDWTRMFVSKLLATHKGNCHSLPFLYKILAEEMHENAYLALAPNHIYIKHWSKKHGWYNTELTSRAFPVDAWLMVSGYVSLTAIQNGVYLDTLSNNQSLALCLVDLAKGFDRKYPKADGSFTLKCCNKALLYYPHCANALLLKAETKKKQLEIIMKAQGKTNFQDILGLPQAGQVYAEMNKLYAQIYQTGYHEMPEKMYFDWLLSLQAEKEKYNNTKIFPNFNKPKKK
jgi:hypothetical protein